MTKREIQRRSDKLHKQTVEALVALVSLKSDMELFVRDLRMAQIRTTKPAPLPGFNNKSQRTGG